MIYKVTKLAYGADGADGGAVVDTKLIVKICGITSEADALLAVGMGADALGFIMAPSPRQVSISVVSDIVKRLPHGITSVGVFRDESPKRVVELANHIGLSAVQLHGHETAEECRWIRAHLACTIRAFPAGRKEIGRFDEFGADYLLIDGASPGSGEVFDWRLAEGVVDPSRLIVSGGLSASNVDQAIRHLHPAGVDVCSGVEESPGRKDPQKLRDFVSVARREADGTAAGPTRGSDREGPKATTGADYSDGSGTPETLEEREPYDWMDM